MRDWIKPELIIEEFELSQHVASGCGTRVSNASYPKDVELKWRFKNGKDDFTNTYPRISAATYDSDEDGYIDRNEFTNFLSGQSGPHNYPILEIHR